MDSISISVSLYDKISLSVFHFDSHFILLCFTFQVIFQNLNSTVISESGIPRIFFFFVFLLER